MTLYTVIIKTIKGSLLTIFHFLFHIYRIYKANIICEVRMGLSDFQISQFWNDWTRSEIKTVRHPYILMEKETLRELQFDMGVLHS
jgi:hypothetical protein